MNKRLALKALASVLFVLFAISLANAQNPRTWVASGGSDVGGCTRVAPCATFQYALSVTDALGEIDAVDSGDFGRVTIAKSVTIDGNGFAKITGNAGGNAVGINAGPNDVIVLRGLALGGVGAGGGVSTFGIQFSAGKALHVEDCQIVGFNLAGIDFEPAAAGSELYVSGTSISNIFATGSSAGIFLRSTAGTSVAKIDRVRLERAGFGLEAMNNMKVTATNTSATGNNSIGFFANGGGAPVEMNLVLCTASNNTVAGVQSSGALSVIRLSSSTVTVNGLGLASVSGGSIFTALPANNVVQGNGVNGTGTGTFPLS